MTVNRRSWSRTLVFLLAPEDSRDAADPRKPAKAGAGPAACGLEKCKAPFWLLVAVAASSLISLL